jgi:hypothetical protein
MITNVSGQLWNSDILDMKLTDVLMEVASLVRKFVRLVYIFGVDTSRKLLRRFHLPHLVRQSATTLVCAHSARPSEG